MHLHDFIWPTTNDRGDSASLVRLRSTPEKETRMLLETKAIQALLILQLEEDPRVVSAILLSLQTVGGGRNKMQCLAWERLIRPLQIQEPQVLAQLTVLCESNRQNPNVVWLGWHEIHAYITSAGQIMAPAETPTATATSNGGIDMVPNSAPARHGDEPSSTASTDPAEEAAMDKQAREIVADLLHPASPSVETAAQVLQALFPVLPCLRVVTELLTIPVLSRLLAVFATSLHARHESTRTVGLPDSSQQQHWWLSTGLFPTHGDDAANIVWFCYELACRILTDTFSAHADDGGGDMQSKHKHAQDKQQQNGSVSSLIDRLSLSEEERDKARLLSRRFLRAFEMNIDVLRAPQGQLAIKLLFPFGANGTGVAIDGTGATQFAHILERFEHLLGCQDATAPFAFCPMLQCIRSFIQMMLLRDPSRVDSQMHSLRVALAPKLERLTSVEKAFIFKEIRVGRNEAEKPAWLAHRSEQEGTIDIIVEDEGSGDSDGDRSDGGSMRTITVRDGRKYSVGQVATWSRAGENTVTGRVVSIRPDATPSAPNRCKVDYTPVDVDSQGSSAMSPQQSHNATTFAPASASSQAIAPQVDSNSADGVTEQEKMRIGSHFFNVTGMDPAEAVPFLASRGYDVQTAVADFFALQETSASPTPQGGTRAVTEQWGLPTPAEQVQSFTACTAEEARQVGQADAVDDCHACFSYLIIWREILAGSAPSKRRRQPSCQQCLEWCRRWYQWWWLRHSRARE